MSLGRRVDTSRGLTHPGAKDAPQPIETAPQDGTRILAWPCEVNLRRVGDDYVSVTGWATVAWDPYYKKWYASPCEATEYNPDSHSPTHWLPLPGAPE